MKIIDFFPFQRVRDFVYPFFDLSVFVAPLVFFVSQHHPLLFVSFSWENESTNFFLPGNFPRSVFTYPG